MRKIIGCLVFTALAPVSQIALAQVQVVTSFSIIGDIAAQIGGDAVEVTDIVGPDQDAHVYSPSVADARALVTADLIVLNGLGFETWAEALVAGSGTSASIVTVTDALPLVLHNEEEEDHDEHGDHEDAEHHDEHEVHGHDDHEDHKDHDDHGHEDHGHEEHKDEGGHDDHEDHGKETMDAHAHHDHGEFDPHAWGAMVNAIVYAQVIRDALIAVDPDQATIYAANFNAFEAEGLLLRDGFAARIAALPADHRTVVTSHDAFGYLAEETGLRFLAPKGFNSASVANAGEVRELIETLRALPHAAVFVESLHNSALVDQIAAEANLVVSDQVLYSDALSGLGGPAGTYLDYYRHNLESILTALEAN